MRFRHFICLIVICGRMSLYADSSVAQDLGHKLPGLIGLDAARIPEPGLYVANRLVSYRANEIRARDGSVIPIRGLDMHALANGVGIAYTIKLKRSSFSLSMAASAPIARLRLNIEDRPEASFDRFGLTDIYIQPARLGWRNNRFDVVGAYSLYLPTDQSLLAGGKGLSSGHTTHQFSAGGTAYFKNDRTAFLTTLASYDNNRRKRNIDITRGDIFQIQGGAGVSLFDRRIETGVAGYWLRQVSADRGADLPPVLEGVRDRVYGIGPEVAVTMKTIRSQIRMRYEWDLGVQSRPRGNIFVVGVNFVAMRPQTPRTP